MMYSKLLKFHYLSGVGSIFLLVTQLGTVHGADDFSYFGSEIDYWHDRKTKPMVTTSREKRKAPDDAKADVKSDSGFEWKKYLDPKNREFFKEGEYIPPEPFMEIVRNPSDANLKMWFSYIDKRNELSNQLQTRMKEYLEKNGPALDDRAKASIMAKVAALPRTSPDSRRFRFRMYFDSHCPHCKRMFGTLSELQSKGFYVEARQVDADSSAVAGLPIPSQRASEAELREKGVQSVPLLLVGDLEKKAVYRISGYQSASNIFQAISQASSSP